MPSVYYCTHALGPLMYVTDLWPTAVSALSIPPTARQRQAPVVRRSDPSTPVLCRTNNQGVFLLNGGWNGLPGSGIWYRFQGERGLMENLRSGHHDELRVVHEAWDLAEGEVPDRVYRPAFPVARELAAAAGHGGADYFVLRFFAEAIRSGRTPWCDVYRGLAMSVVGIQAWRSALAEGAPQEIPDFRDKSSRARYEADHWSPFPEDAGPGQPPPSILGRNEPSSEQVTAARALWRQRGYEVQ